ncbi:hypothetical protein [Streptomyces lydicus]|uniref:hypothetical protein n=1 Tax=Streptomyces lydicus TaxID=47763 RepID=UPI00378D74A6
MYGWGRHAQALLPVGVLEAADRPRAGERPPGPRRRRPRLAPHLQPFLVFGALVAIAVAASALAGAGYDDFGWARP